MRERYRPPRDKSRQNFASPRVSGSVYIRGMKLPVLLALASAASAADMFPFQLPWDDSTPSITNIAWLNDKPAGRDGFVHVKDGHLFAGEKRLRIFGVNMCFAANFPNHDDADKIAARLAKFGINCVRFHHMDMFSAPAGIFEKDGRTLDAGQLDKLDYFIAALKKHGIYANLNLHVSRTYPDLPKAEKKGSPQFDKGVDNYHAPMIALQKTYARDLLTHVNKYTGNPYATEPAVALVEINNENALGFQWFAREMDDLPPIYKEDLETQWGAWILKKYGDDAAARKAWSEGERAPGKELIGEMKQASRIRSDIFGPMRQIASFAESDDSPAANLAELRAKRAKERRHSCRRLETYAKRTILFIAFTEKFGASRYVLGSDRSRKTAEGNVAAPSRKRVASDLETFSTSKETRSAFYATFTSGSENSSSLRETFLPLCKTTLSLGETFSALCKTTFQLRATCPALCKTMLPLGKTFTALCKNSFPLAETLTALETPQCLNGSTFSLNGLAKGANRSAQCVEQVHTFEESFNKTRNISYNFETHGSAMAKSTLHNGKISVIVDEPGSESWHVQFTLGEISLAAGSYEVKFRAKGPAEGEISVALQQSSSPWKVLGSAKANVSTDWRDVSVIVSVGSAEERGRLTIGGMGLTEGHFDFSDFSLRSVGIDGGLVRDAKGRVPMVKKRELSRVTPAKQRDWQEFLWDTELVYWNGMRDFLKKELGVRAPIVGTQGFWSSGHVQSGMDVIDSHAYWEHPDFEGGAWNPERWTVKNIPMSGVKGGGTLPALAAQRVKGKPFICTEYNHSAPNTYGAEMAPIIAAFAALQDWDGVFIFAYSHNDKWQQEHFDSFFDIARHPVKMATLPGAVLSFRRPDPSYPSTYIPQSTIGIVRSKAPELALTHGPSFTSGIKAFEKHEVFTTIFDFMHDLDEAFFSPEQKKQGFAHAGRSGVGRSTTQWFDFAWNRNEESGNASAELRSRTSAFVIGNADLFEARAGSFSNEKVRIRNSARSWASYQLTAMDEMDLATSKRLLITATGSIENTKMGWKNAERTTVGRDWGMPPVLVEGPKATIDLPEGGRFKAWALDERGQRREEVPVRDAKLEIGPQFKTLWYEVERL
ncbi:MAG: hypothetical protein RL088_2709 [Verrucomicrobiota bacterium]|jgi:hypothetical protein